MRALFATAELEPVVSVGGLAHASSGLVRELRRQGIDVEVALPDYGGAVLAGEERLELDVPRWAAPAAARRGEHEEFGPLMLVSVPGIERPHPYHDADGAAWPDNDARFIAFGVAVGALAAELGTDVVHLNDWHTSTAAATLQDEIAVVLSVHNLAHQGRTGPQWLPRLVPNSAAYAFAGGCNPLAGAIRLADVIAVVSPTYREEVLHPDAGAGLDGLLRRRGDAVLGILNGIDAEVWNPESDRYLAVSFTVDDLSGKARARSALLARMGLPERSVPVAVAVARLADQKGIDLLLPLVPELDALGAQMAILGSGDAVLAAALHRLAADHPASLAFVEGYDEALAHQLIAGGDLVLMPSRFEPCGLTQMQAMRYGTLPVVTDVGGLHDTVVDLDDDPEHGTGWRAATPDVEAVRDAFVRAVRGCADSAVRQAAQRRGMSTDWSWSGPAARYVDLYHRVSSTSEQG